MANAVEGASRRLSWRAVGWTAAALALLAPLVAMEVSDGVAWTVGDILFAATLLGLIGLTLELTVRASGNGWYRAGMGAALAASLVIIWANGAVGMIGSEENPYNLYFFGVIALALAGSVLAQFKPGGMALAMLGAGTAQIFLGAAGLAADPRGGTYAILLGGLWLVAAALFGRCARDQRP